MSVFWYVRQVNKLKMKNSINPLNVFMIGWEYPPHNSGGLGVACQGITEALAAQNHSIFFTLPYSLKNAPAHMSVMSCRDPLWEVPADLPPFLAYDPSQFASLNPDVIPKIPAHDLASLPSSEIEIKVSQYADLVAKEAKKHTNEYQVIHAHDWMSFPAAMKVKRQSGKPLVSHIHSTEYDRIPSGYGSQYITQIEQSGMAASDVVIAVSEYTKRLLIQKYAIPAKKIKVVHNGMFFSPHTDPGTHHFAQNQPVVVFMGRLTGQKGPEYFVALANKVLEQIPNALFVVAGNGDMYHSLLLSTASQGLSAKVLFSGFVRDKQRETLLDRADVFVMPSLSEPFGLVALEAAERNTPVIISKHTGVSEVLPSAIAIDFWDVQKMSDTIVQLLGDASYKNAVVQNHQNELQRVTWQAAAQKLDAIYRSVAN